MDQKILHFTMKAALYAKASDNRDVMAKEAVGLQDITGALSNAWNGGKANVMQAYSSLSPQQKQVLLGGLIGGGAGAGLGGIHAMTQSKNKRHLLRDMLSGGLAGSGLGAGGTYLLGGPPSVPVKLPVENKADAAAAAGVNWANDPAMKMLNTAPSMALAPNPAAMMNAAVAGAAAPGPSSVQDVYNRYVQDKSPEQWEGYKQHLINDLGNPGLAKDLQKIHEQNRPAIEGVANWYYNSPVIAGGFTGGALGATKGFEKQRAIEKANLLKQQHDPIGHALGKMTPEERAKLYENFNILDKDPLAATVGKHNQMQLTLGGAKGVGAPDAQMGANILKDVRKNPNGFNQHLGFLEPNMVDQEVPRAPKSVPDKNLSGYLGAEPHRPAAKQKWDGTWRRGEPGGIHNRNLFDLNAAALRGEGMLPRWGRMGREAAKGGGKGTLAGVGLGVLGGYVLPWLKDNLKEKLFPQETSPISP